MIGLFVTAAVAGAPPGDPLVDLFRTWLARDGVRADPATLAARAEALCPTRPLACVIGPQPPETLPPAVPEACAAGDAVACLVEAWSLLPLASTGRDLGGLTDPERFSALVHRACDAGIADGCVEIGSMYGRGIGTYQSERRAIGLLRPLCAKGYGRACTALGTAIGEPNLVTMGAAAGDPAALGRSRSEADRRRACAMGHTATCLTLEGLDAAAYDRVCTLGDPAGCVARIVLDAASGARPASEAAAALDPLCPREPLACEQAAFLRQGAAPTVVYTGEIGPHIVERKIIAARDALFACYVDVLRGDRAAGGVFEVVLRVEPDLTVSGVYAARPLTPTHGSCVTKALLGFPLAAPFGHGPAKLTVPFAASHAATIGIRGIGPEDLNYAERVFEDLPRWEGPLDACFLDHDAPELGVSMEVGFLLKQSGDLAQIRVLRSSETPAVDRCVVDFLHHRSLPGPPDLPARLVAEINFLTARWDHDPPAPPSFAERRKNLPPVEVRTLVLLVDRTASASGTARLSSGARARIAEAHEAMAARIAQGTGGLVRLVTEVREIDTALTGARVAEIEDGVFQLAVDPDPLTPSLLAAIAPGRWDSVFVWGAAPDGAAAPDLGQTLDRQLLRGATASFLAVQGDFDVPPGASAAAVPLHEWWHQVVARADRLLGADLAPNHDPIVVEIPDPTTDDPLAPPLRKTLDPRTWLERPSRTVDEWYAEALSRVEPEMWTDLWRYGARVSTESGNVALSATVVTDSVLDPIGLNDTWIDPGSFLAIPRVDPDALDFSFGLMWDEPVTAHTLTAYVGRLDAPSEPSFTASAIDVITAADPGQWRSLSTPCTLTDATLSCALPTSPIRGVRLRPPDVGAVVREMEVR